mgnify:CR=1 FL=1
MQKEIGSNFWISPTELEQGGQLGTPSEFGCVGSDYVWLSTGRSALHYVLKTIEERNPQINKIAILPPFTCHTVIEPFIEMDYQIKTYHIGLDLQASAEEILSLVRETKAGIVLYHKYFGKDTIFDLDKVICKIREEHAEIVEDCTQNLYSLSPKSDADYYVGSIRKWCGVPDGGFAVCRKGYFSNKPVLPDVTLQEAKKEASIMKYNYLFNEEGSKADFLGKYKIAEAILDSQSKIYTISNLSAVIQSHLDVDTVRRKRQRNYHEIESGIKGIEGIRTVFGEINGDEIPLYCPIYCDNRKEIQSLLVQHSVYAPVVWPKAECCPPVDKDSDYIYDHILCIPIDQRYDIDDMQRVIDILKSK